MSEIVLLDAVNVAALARAARDRGGAASDPEHVAALTGYADELDDVTEAAVSLDQHEHEIEHQLRWWQDRVGTLEAELTGHPADDVEVVRELALYRGRISGAQTMRRHYVEQRIALVARLASADVQLATVVGDPG